MFNALLDLLFGCTHERTTWPQGRKPYVCCLECGREFPYDLQAMRRLPPVKQDRKSGVFQMTIERELPLRVEE